MRFALGLLALAALAGAAAAQDCVDWNLSLSAPSLHPELQGAHLELAGNICYIGGDSLLVVDVSAVDSPVLLGHLRLPASATDLVLAGTTVFAACGDSGVVEIRCDQPSLPVRGRTYSSAAGPIAVAGRLLAAVAADGQVPLFDVSEGGGTAPVGVAQAAAAACGVGFLDGVLLVLDESGGVTPVSVADPGAPVAGARYRSNSYPGATLLAAGLGHVFVIDTDRFDYEYGTTITHRLTRLGLVAGQGLVAEESAVCAEGGLEIAGSLLVRRLARRPATRLLDPATFAIKLSVGTVNDLAIEDGRMATIEGDGGLVLRTQADVGAIQPVAVIGGDGTANGLGRYTCVSSGTTTYSGVGGGYSARLEYEIFDLQDPLHPVSLAAGELSTYWSVWEDAGGVYAGVCADDRFVTVVSRYTTERSYYSLPSGAFLGRLVSTTDYHFPGRMWSYNWELAELTCYQVDPEAGLQELASWPWTGPCYGVISPDGSTMLVAGPEGYDVIDASDPGQFVELGHASLPFPGFASGVWHGRTFYFSRNSTLYAVDFSDLLNPVVLPETALGPDALITRLSISGNRILLLTGPGWQIAEVDSTGVPALASPLMPVNGGKALLDGDLVYVGDGDHGLQLFDVTDAAHPVWIGQALGDAGTLTATGGWLVAGHGVLPLHCVGSTPIALLRPQARLAWSSGCGGGRPAIAVAVLGSRTFDAAGIDLATVTCGPDLATTAGPARLADFDGDGVEDLIIEFHGVARDLACGNAAVTVEGRTAEGAFFSAEASLAVERAGFGPAGVAVELAPNPFNPILGVRYVLDRGDRVKVSVFDLRGRRVAVLADGREDAGPHDLTWNGTDEAGRLLSSGAYFVRFETARGAQTAKAMLLR